MKLDNKADYGRNMGLSCSQASPWAAQDLETEMSTRMERWMLYL